ncbi:MAG: hypothetical protein JNM69_36975 [Archangium sp.]|nr:hypothetical protein [Archangium sp.]
MFRTISFALTSSFLAGLAMSGCFAAQPPPQCQTVSTQDFNGNPPYLAMLKQTSASAACTEGQKLASMLVGVQDYIPPGGGAAKLVLRPGRLVDLAQGNVFKADIDAKNDCQAKKNCGSCGPDGGNPCLFVDDPVTRSDPEDPEGKKLNALGGFARAPSNGICAASEPLVASQNFEARTLALVDGGMATLPALPATFSFSDVKVITTFEVPGTAFTAKLAQTEGACVAAYDVVAFYPSIACEADVDCDPNTDLDAGRNTGSGINPDFAPKCDTDLGFCVPTVDVTKPGLPKLP